MRPSLSHQDAAYEFYIVYTEHDGFPIKKKQDNEDWARIRARLERHYWMYIEITDDY